MQKANPFVSIVLAAAICASMGGCVAAPIILVGVGAVGGYAISRDTFEGTTAKSQDELWDSSMRVASIMGTVDEHNRKRGEIFARINGVNVDITVVPVSLTTTKLRVKARAMIFPRIAVAQEVYSKIMNQTEQ